MARMANRARRDMSHEVGDSVWLATKNLPLKLGTRKLASIWAGPFRVLSCVGPVAYRLELPVDWRIHDVSMFLSLRLWLGIFSGNRSCLLSRVQSLRLSGFWMFV